MQGDNDHTETLLRRLNSSGKVHMVPASFKGKYVIRFTVTSQYTQNADIVRDWSIIQETARKVLADEEEEEIEQEEEAAKDDTAPEKREALNQDDLINQNEKLSMTGQMRREGMKRKEFGLSLILSNVPRSPKFINGSFAALFDTNDIIMEYARHLSRKSLDFNGRPIRLSPRKRLKDQNKQYSFDLNLFPSNRRSLQPHKQGSLDSKIEEIFDTSSQASYDSDPEGDAEADGKAIIFGFVEKEDKGVQSPPEQDFPLPHTVDNGTHINGLRPILCKHCGHVVEG